MYHTLSILSNHQNEGEGKKKGQSSSLFIIQLFGKSMAAKLLDQKQSYYSFHWMCIQISRRTLADAIFNLGFGQNNREGLEPSSGLYWHASPP